ncbi:hypothetical protein A1O1_01407 [Capronia coronata CBS 617.96]|uniref:Uncharacterized protein n=1 Tax=Capronia coronata CBS 617.96 TaxID=1182541 RepID=W9Z3W3_9EURO|nr:uncharacterized protein A1O1_01407 [Capronia coronata CBS 617.96]EXJ96281.1 hypothetical protein A1O1_01407 [Capronia coronata CBS 617.96]
MHQITVGIGPWRPGGHKRQKGSDDGEKIGQVVDVEAKSCPLSEVLEHARLHMRQYERLQNIAVAKAKLEVESKMSALEVRDSHDTEQRSISSSSKRRRKHRRQMTAQRVRHHPITGAPTPVPAVYGTVYRRGYEVENGNEAELQQQTPYGAGPQEGNWRVNMRDNIHRMPKQERHNHARWIRSLSLNPGVLSPPTANDWIVEGPSRIHGEEDLRQSSEPDPRRQLVTWENWALSRMLQEYVGLNDSEIGFLLSMELKAAKKRWG